MPSRTEQAVGRGASGRSGATRGGAARRVRGSGWGLAVLNRSGRDWASGLQTVAKLLDFRNTIAHGRSVQINAKPEVRDADGRIEAYLGERPLTDWEKLIQTSDFAIRAREDVHTVLERIHEGRKDEKEGLFARGFSFHRATSAEP